jgi:hypothetical protein
MRATISAAISVVCALSLVACGDKAVHQQQKQAKRPAQLVSDVVTALQHDLGTRNYRDLCEQVFSSQARAAAGGVSCPDSLARESKGVKDPTIVIKRIDVNGRSAVAEVVTSAAGQAKVPETIQLVWENGRYRVSALAGTS